MYPHTNRVPPARRYAGSRNEDSHHVQSCGVTDLRSLFRLISVADGQSLVEYALVIALVASAVVACVAAFGGGLSGLYHAILQQLPF